MISPEKYAEFCNILNRQFSAGTKVTNCISHSGINYTDRKEGCSLCFTDIKNHISFCHTVNEFLNEQITDLKKVL